MKTVVFACILGVVACQRGYVWDLLRPPLDAGEVEAILSAARADGSSYPMYDSIPETNFDCFTKHQPGFYADQQTGCQVFHRCDINGNHTKYLCVNTTLFNQITLTCDYFFNIDCPGFVQYEDLANSRLYSDLPLFDSPPADYVPLYLQQQAQAGVRPGQNVVQLGGRPGKVSSQTSLRPGQGVAQTGIRPVQSVVQTGIRPAQSVAQNTCPVMNQRCSPKLNLCRRDDDCGSGGKCCQMDCNVRKCQAASPGGWSGDDSFQSGLQPGQGSGHIDVWPGQDFARSTCPLMKQRCAPKLNLCRRDDECGSGQRCCQMDCDIRKCL